MNATLHKFWCSPQTPTNTPRFGLGALAGTAPLHHCSTPLAVALLARRRSSLPMVLPLLTIAAATNTIAPLLIIAAAAACASSLQSPQEQHTNY